jgi:hypothetical protein
MAAARSPSRGLSTEELESIRDGLAAGRKPRIVFTDAAGQMAGQAGQVVALNDPEVDEEWVVVRFGRDELPFSPADLAIPAKTSAARGAAAKVATAPAPEFKITRETKPAAVPAPRQEETVPEKSASTVEANVVPAQAGEAKPARKATGARGGKAKVASLTVTLAYADGEWTVAANQGAKPLAKPYLIKPAEALKMVGMLDVPTVHEAVEQILTSERAEVEQRAQALRAELAEVEAKLADLKH